jgi:hypothetical protein
MAPRKGFHCDSWERVLVRLKGFAKVRPQHPGNISDQLATKRPNQLYDNNPHLYHYVSDTYEEAGIVRASWKIPENGYPRGVP